MTQYEIWWAQLPAPVGRRPVLLLSRESAYSVLSKVIAAEITTTIRDIAVEIALGPREGLPRACVANCDNLRTIAKENLVERISQLQSTRIPDVKRAVGFALGWEELIEATG